MKKIIFLFALVITTPAIYAQDETLEVKGKVLYKDQVNSLKPPVPILDVPQSVSVITDDCLLYTSPSPRDPKSSRMPSSA